MINLEFDPEKDDLYGEFDGEETEANSATRQWLKKSFRNQLKAELYRAERRARIGGKRKTYDTHSIEAYLDENIETLTDEIYRRYYEPLPGTAHNILNPVKREIFAAPYPDRDVHHWVVDTINPWWDKRLNVNASSCRVGKGTSYAIRRLDKHIRQASGNYARPVYVVKLDISGYFMHIDRKLLLERVLWGLDKQFKNKKGERYRLLKHVITQIIMDDPTNGVKIQGSYEDWRDLPEDKSMFTAPPGCGIVIGNVTSQVFSNIYLDPLDRFITLDLGYKYYGRYVDDFYIVVTEDQLPQVKRDIKAINNFLNGIGLWLNKKKTRIIPSWQGVPFLGMVVKHGAIVPGKRLTRNYSNAVREYLRGAKNEDSVASYLGMMKNYNSWNVIVKAFGAKKMMLKNFEYVLGDVYDLDKLLK